MGKSDLTRRQLGLLFYSSNMAWAGGVIYILNIIRALNLLSDDEKPEILLFHSYASPLREVTDINYPYIKFYEIHSSNKFKKVYYLLKRLLTGKSAFIKLLPELVYPYNEDLFLGRTPVNWIPDFQEWYLPEMFTETDIKNRKRYQQSIADNAQIVVFSSQDAMNDFNKFYPDNRCTVKLLRFASILPKFEHLDITSLKQKYSIGQTYFLTPNQFWKHKNHKIILEALVLLKQQNLDFQIVFTGSPNDYRNKEFFQSLMNFIELNELQKWVVFLGFIDRADQLSLMYHALAIIQPSLFEGWSTVVEDTKALNQFIILSDIPVHREQINANCRFFDPHTATQLASIIEETVSSPPEKQFIDYFHNITEFSENILKVVNTDSK
jgi:glycosyltransferase involved in cell wall biosynthesis